MKNVAFALAVLAVAIVLLAITGWGISFVTGVELSPEITEPHAFWVRVLVGIMFLGLLNGCNTLWNFAVRAYWHARVHL